MKRGYAHLVTASVAVALSLSGATSAQTTSFANVSSAGAKCGGIALEAGPRASADGRFVAFSSTSSNLVPDDTNGKSDVFVHDRLTGATERVSLTDQGQQAKLGGAGQALSSDGRFVVFVSMSNDLVPGISNGYTDVFVRDRLLSTTVRASLGSAGQEPDRHCGSPSLSADGRYVAFVSAATNLVPGDLNGGDDVFLRDLVTGTIEVVSVDPRGLPAGGGGPSISGDGRWVAFGSYGSTLVAGDTNGEGDVFVRDRLTGTTQRVSVDGQGQQASGSSMRGAISEDGRVVVFDSVAPDLVPGDTNGYWDVFVHVLGTGATERVSLSSSGGEANDFCWFASISSQGRFVSFTSWATNLVPGDTLLDLDVFVHDRLTGQTTWESIGLSGAEGNGESLSATLSGDGMFVVFVSTSTNLVPGDGVGEDIFVRDRQGCSPTLAHYCTASGTSIPGCQATLSASGTPSVSAPLLFSLSSGPVPGGALGIAYLGTSGPEAAPMGTQGGMVCVRLPVRTPAKGSGGTPGQCDGLYAWTLAELMAAKPSITSGSTVHAALWFRDSGSNDGFGLSDGLWFQVCP